ncbi:hypothetical protein GP486_007803 [Trichoglossum hirsutum]|uniref:FMN hydroxy acid dehydrogenase domain-containing protein n=1 Tax=Trichoglossum hirsutum TaxID=265104 RepID=A0A9P8IHS3_9PEZI|nr:hypothetical protein GP486_007803 [Trichoglossum hirsutum]
MVSLKRRVARKVIFQYAGKDATQTYNEVHTISLLPRTLTTSKLVGKLDPSTIDAAQPPTQRPTAQESDQSKPPLTSVISPHDFEAIARGTLSKKAWAFYSSAATDLIADKANKSFYDRVWFRPRILLDVRDISINSSYPIEEVVSAATVGYPFFFQLYVNKHRPSSESLLKRVWDLGIRTLFLTVDAPVPGKREADERVRIDGTLSTPMSGTTAINDKAGSSLARTMGTYIDPSLSWKDLVWIRNFWKGKVVVKGIQAAEDAKKAADEGVDGIVLRTVSNHGGRNLDTSPPVLLTLLELRRHFPEVFGQVEVYVDGGIRRGTDILKALCLGATAVSIGRTFLYALSYGESGVEHLIDMLRDELETAMRLVGITDLSQAHPGLVNTGDIDHLVPSTLGRLYAGDGPPKAKI